MGTVCFGFRSFMHPARSPTKSWSIRIQELGLRMATPRANPPTIRTNRKRYDAKNPAIMEVWVMVREGSVLSHGFFYVSKRKCRGTGNYWAWLSMSLAGKGSTCPITCHLTPCPEHRTTRFEESIHLIIVLSPSLAPSGDAGSHTVTSRCNLAIKTASLSLLQTASSDLPDKHRPEESHAKDPVIYQIHAQDLHRTSMLWTRLRPRGRNGNMWAAWLMAKKYYQQQLGTSG